MQYVNFYAWLYRTSICCHTKCVTRTLVLTQFIQKISSINLVLNYYKRVVLLRKLLIRNNYKLCLPEQYTYILVKQAT